jgi:hypothetical protein
MMAVDLGAGELAAVPAAAGTAGAPTAVGGIEGGMGSAPADRVVNSLNVMLLLMGV